MALASFVIKKMPYFVKTTFGSMHRLYICGFLINWALVIRSYTIMHR